MTAFTPSDRLTHLADAMHRAEMSNGSSVPSNWVLASVGSNFGITWSPQAAAGAAVSYGSNAMDVTEADNGGASTDVSRMDHRHRGVHLISSAGSNSLFGDINFIGQGSVGVTVSGQTIQFSGPGNTSAGGGGGSSPLEAIYGDGNDGAVVISVNSAATRDMYFSDLTINTGITYDTAGFRIFVKGTLTLTGTAKINRPPSNGGLGLNGTAVAGGGAGAAGSAVPGGNTINSSVGRVGVVGGFNANGGAGSASTISNMNISHSTSAAGGNAPGRTGGAGAASTGDNTLSDKPVAYPEVIQWRDRTGNQVAGAAVQGIAPSAGSGAGNPSAGGGGSGGSGAGGGFIVVIARVITGSGTIEAIGGTGGAGGNGFNVAVNTGGGGGGSGGAGGVIVLIYNDKSGWSGSAIVTGGAGGAAGLGAGTGTNGGAGTQGPNGLTYIYKMG